MWWDQSPIRWTSQGVEVLDQQRLPHEVVWLRIATPEEMANAIRSLKIRGAPAIGVAAAMGMALAFQNPRDFPPDPEGRRAYFRSVRELLFRTRPTAVNLRWALDRMQGVFEQVVERTTEEIFVRLKAEALAIQAEDVELNRRIGAFGAQLFPRPVNILTICNTGSLATAGYGTALGVIRTLWREKRLKGVYACETRPVLQGARLTMWELLQDGIPAVLICDGAAGYAMQRGLVDAVITGADRIAANGDTANKIGTYPLAVLAHHHGVPFYVAAPYSTIDMNLAHGGDIPIEERDAEEVRRFGDCRIAPEDALAWNPAFDVTPAQLIHGIITDRGILRPPFAESIARAMDEVSGPTPEAAQGG